MTSPSRLLFLISLYSSSNTSTAGHSFSLRELSKQFSLAWPESEIRILVIGDLESASLRDSTVTVSHIDLRGKSLLSFIKEILSYGDKFNPTHVHSFDNKSHFFGRWIASRNNAKVFLTKPGGPNPGRLFPFSPDIVCFSQENLDSLRGRKNLSHARFHYLPQRVAVPIPDLPRIARLRDKIGDGDILLRICRIGPYYEHSIRQTLNLAKNLRNKGVNVRALILGTVQSEDTLHEMQKLAGIEDIFINDKEFTSNAAELIPIAHAVVGAGRSLIEAALLRKVIFAPVADSGLPVLLTTENWKHLWATNFSERTLSPPDVPDLDSIQNALATQNLAVNDEITAEMSIDAAIPKYESMYDQNQMSPSNWADFLINSASVIAQYYPSKRKSAKVAKAT